MIIKISQRFIISKTCYKPITHTDFISYGSQSSQETNGTENKSLLGRHILGETFLRVCVKHGSSPPLITKKIQIFPEAFLWSIRERVLHKV